MVTNPTPEQFIIRRGPFVAATNDWYIVTLQWAGKGSGTCCELVPVAEADRLRAIEAKHAQIVDLWLSIDGDDEDLCNAQWTQLFALLDGES